MPYPHERQLRRELLRFAHLCYERGLLVGLDGNLSVRLYDDLVLCTQAGSHKGLLTDDELLVTDMDGRKIRGRGTPTSELGMHLACYRSRPDIRAIVHAHPPMCVAFTVAGVSMARCVLPEVLLTLGQVPTLSYETTGTEALAEQVGEAVGEHDGVLMDHHGAVAVGATLLEAFCRLETMENMAVVLKAARDLGGIQDLPSDEAARLRRMGIARYGGPPQRDAEPAATELPEPCRGCSGCGNPRPQGLGASAGFSVARLV